MPKPPRPPATASLDYARAAYEARLKLTRARVAQIEKKIDDRAKRAAELSKLRFVQGLLDVVERARRDGISIDEAKEQLRTKLRRGATKATPDSYLSLAITNNVQGAYNSGKVEGFLEPATRELRPFWIFDAVLDFRTSEFCRRCNGVCLPAGASWFMHRIPPCHHWCRSTIRAVTRAVATRHGGVTHKPPREIPSDGFGRLWQGEWKPNLSKVAPALVKAYRSRAT